MKEEIQRRIQEERGRIKRERKKKFSYLKNTGQLDNYYKQKEKRTESIEPIIKTKLKWYQKLWRWIKKL